MGCSLCCDSKNNQKSVLQNMDLANQALKQFLNKYPEISQTHKNLPEWSTSPDKTQIFFNDEGVFMGVLVNQQKNGEGIMLYNQDGFIYEGSWFNDMREGKGRLIYKNGHYYEGLWSKNQPHGQGVYVCPSPYWRYEGEWVDGRQHGKGKEIFDDGSYYEGEWRNGLKHGKGHFVEPGQSYFKGEFQEGEPYGYGKMKQKDYTYEGEWRDGNKTGTGKSEWSKNGTLEATYIGEYKDNRKHGYGEYRWTDQKVFKGKWEKGEMKQAGVIINFEEQQLRSSRRLKSQKSFSNHQEQVNET